jgi:predicted  nucleic acid-binding Zn-ribbon protein
MTQLQQDLLALEELQVFDDKIEKTNNLITSLPLEIENKNKELQRKSEEIDMLKKDYVAHLASIKEQEALLDQKEQTIAKFNIELNAAKSNEVYSSLVAQINKAKADISAIEDNVLTLLEESDKKAALLKNSEAELKELNIKTKEEISQTNLKIQQSKEELLTIEKEREEHKSKISKDTLYQYDRIREGRTAQGLAYIDNGNCSVCGRVLRPQLINQARKFTELVYCDGCSRILFYKD